MRGAAMTSTPKTINVALQGGGAHGAFTWGVLDRLLEDDRIAIEGISGTSAGAMNGAALAQGWIDGGSEGARRSLDAFWRRMSEFAQLGLVHRTPLDRVFGNWNLDYAPGFLFFDALVRQFSPYQLNPTNYHPLRVLLDDFLEVEKIRACTAVKLFVSATNVRTGKIRVFGNPEISVDALLASACLPYVFQSIVIDGDPYWDGGYMGNPALFPLIYGCESRDILVVEINPLTRDDVPRNAAQIMNRLNEISFNSSLMREMRAIAFVDKLISDPSFEGPAGQVFRRVLVHMIGSGDTMQEFGVSSKMNADLEFLLHLKEIGRARAALWIEENIDAVGERSTLDIAEVFF
jgi:NTE family protein